MLEDFFVGSGLVVVGSNGVVSVMVYVICVVVVLLDLILQFYQEMEHH